MKAESEKKFQHKASIAFIVLMLIGSVGIKSGHVQAAQSTGSIGTSVSAVQSLYVAETLKYAVMMRVVTAWDDFTANSWERAFPTKATDIFQLYEATIWPDAVSLYRFDASFDPHQSFHLTPEQWAVYRESYRLMKFDIPAEVDTLQKSQLITNAFIQFFARVFNDTPAEHYSLMYSGHGSGNGGLFENHINPSDARLLFEYIIGLIGKKMDFLDLHTNCSEGNILVVKNFERFFDYIMASDLSVGGYTMDEWSIEKFNETNPEFNYPLLLKPDNSIEQVLLQILDLRRHEWEYSINNMVANQVKQSVSLYKTDAFPALTRSVWPELEANPIQDFSQYQYDLYTYIASLGKPGLIDKFTSFRVEYLSNKNFFNWDIDTNGFSVFSMDQLKPDTFEDVPFDYSESLGGVTYVLYPYIQALFDAGLTAGTSDNPPLYSPKMVLNRAMAAVFMLKGNFGNSYAPPGPPWNTFVADNWNNNSWAQSWAEGMWVAHMTAGCQTNPLKYCPDETLPRVQAVIFGLHMKYDYFDQGNLVSYTPPPASGSVFADLTDPNFYGTAWAEKAYADGLLPACGMQGGKPLFCSYDAVNRAWAAYMIVKAKNIPLP
jgi:hypothetical protein